MPGAVIDVGAMRTAVDRMVELQNGHPIHLGLTEELHDRIHEAITRGLTWMNSGEPPEATHQWMVDHGFTPHVDLVKATGVNAERILISAWVERVRIQALFDSSIDHIVTELG